mmetsp:Transcript_20522/g.51813  ORF Transcript_20522/g.51813 Transcript_20522/m.51813 type:complete len:233 (-) Transcript_20522:504-1202(-)
MKIGSASQRSSEPRNLQMLSRVTKPEPPRSFVFEEPPARTEMKIEYSDSFSFCRATFISSSALAPSVLHEFHVRQRSLPQRHSEQVRAWKRVCHLLRNFLVVHENGKLAEALLTHGGRYEQLHPRRRGRRGAGMCPVVRRSSKLDLDQLQGIHGRRLEVGAPRRGDRDADEELVGAHDVDHEPPRGHRRHDQRILGAEHGDLVVGASCRGCRRCCCSSTVRTRRGTPACCSK